MTTRKKIDDLIEDAAGEDYEGMTKLERQLALSDTTLAGLRVLAKAIDQLGTHLDHIDERLEGLAMSKNDEDALDVIAGGLGLLRKKLKKLAKKR